MHGHFLQMLQSLDHKIENKGDSLVITIKGEKEQLAKIEKIVTAMKNLHEACGEDCCCGGDKTCC